MGVRMGVEFSSEDSAPSPAQLRAQAALDDASALIRNVANLTWVDDEGVLLDTVPDIVVAICLAVAIRAYRNTDGVKQASVGDVSVTYGADSSGAAVFLTREERKAINRAIGRSDASSIPLTPNVLPGISDEMLVEPSNGGDLIPIGPIPWED